MQYYLRWFYEFVYMCNNWPNNRPERSRFRFRLFVKETKTEDNLNLRSVTHNPQRASVPKSGRRNFKGDHSLPSLLISKTILEVKKLKNFRYFSFDAAFSIETKSPVSHGINPIHSRVSYAYSSTGMLYDKSLCETSGMPCRPETTSRGKVLSAEVSASLLRGWCEENGDARLGGDVVMDDCSGSVCLRVPAGPSAVAHDQAWDWLYDVLSTAVGWIGWTRWILPYIWYVPRSIHTQNIRQRLHVASVIRSYFYSTRRLFQDKSKQRMLFCCLPWVTCMPCAICGVQGSGATTAVCMIVCTLNCIPGTFFESCKIVVVQVCIGMYGINQTRWSNKCHRIAPMALNPFQAQAYAPA